MRRRLVVTVLAVTVALAVAVPAGLAEVAGDMIFRPVTGDEPVRFLVIGSDAGPPPRSGRLGSSNADALQLVSVSKNRRHASIVSIPRDSYVPVAGAGRTKINACLFGGPQRCVSTVESVFGVEIDHYVLLSMRGFATGMRKFGGLRVDVGHPVYDGGNPVRQAGEQHLSGLQVLAYARDRKNRPRGDFTRSAAQGEVIKLAHRKVRKRQSVGGVLDALELFRTYTVTDMSAQQLVRHAYTAMRLPSRNIDRALLPGSNGFAGAAAVVYLGDGAYGLVRDAADGSIKS